MVEEIARGVDVPFGRALLFARRAVDEAEPILVEFVVAIVPVVVDIEVAEVGKRGLVLDALDTTAPVGEYEMAVVLEETALGTYELWAAEEVAKEDELTGLEEPTAPTGELDITVLLVGEDKIVVVEEFATKMPDPVVPLDVDVELTEVADTADTLALASGDIDVEEFDKNSVLIIGEIDPPTVVLEGEMNEVALGKVVVVADVLSVGSTVIPVDDTVVDKLRDPAVAAVDKDRTAVAFDEEFAVDEFGSAKLLPVVFEAIADELKTPVGLLNREVEEEVVFGDPIFVVEEPASVELFVAGDAEVEREPSIPEVLFNEESEGDTPDDPVLVIDEVIGTELLEAMDDALATELLGEIVKLLVDALDDIVIPVPEELTAAVATGMVLEVLLDILPGVLLGT
ncbi:MAG: hypothetical protein M1822_008135 [Bathelium mastoideum]|nr:MAG: hypothetical protein M1822_008135 [Bathelium mastoideum]